MRISKLFIASLIAVATTSSHALVYSQWGAGYSGTATATGTAAGVLVAFDDYSTTSSGPLLDLDVFRFGGGVSGAGVGRTMQFVFFDTSLVQQNAFSVNFGAGTGNFLWTLTLSGTFVIPTQGVVGVYVMADTIGTVFGIADPPPIQVGFSDLNYGTFSLLQPKRNMAMQMEGTGVPEPGTMAVVGLGLLAIARRRRSK